MISDTLSDAVQYIREALKDDVVEYPASIRSVINDTVARMDETRDLLDRLSIGIDDETPRSAYGTRYHFSDGPCDGLELFVRGIPHQIELMVLSAGHPSDSRRTAATYRHIGEPGEPDQLAPFFSVDLDHVPDQTTIPAVGN